VDVIKSTVTINTDKGPRVFDIDANTGAFLDGKVCSIADIDAASELGTNTKCEVIYYLDDQGNLIYLDISRP